MMRRCTWLFISISMKLRSGNFGPTKESDDHGFLFLSFLLKMKLCSSIVFFCSFFFQFFRV